MLVWICEDGTWDGSSEATAAPKTFDVILYETYSYVQSTEHQEARNYTKGGGGGPNEPCGAQIRVSLRGRVSAGRESERIQNTLYRHFNLQ